MAMAAQMSKMSEDSIYREELHKGRLYKVSLGLETAAGDPVPVKKEFPVSKFGWSPITLKLLPGVPVVMKIKLVPSGLVAGEDFPKLAPSCAVHNLGSIEAKDSKGKGVEMDDEHAVTLEKLDEGWWAAEWLPAVKEGMNSNGVRQKLQLVFSVKEKGVFEVPLMAKFYRSRGSFNFHKGQENLERINLMVHAPEPDSDHPDGPQQLLKTKYMEYFWKSTYQAFSYIV